MLNVSTTKKNPFLVPNCFQTFCSTSCTQYRTWFHRAPLHRQDWRVLCPASVRKISQRETKARVSADDKSISVAAWLVPYDIQNVEWRISQSKHSKVGRCMTICVKYEINPYSLKIGHWNTSFHSEFCDTNTNSFQCIAITNITCIVLQ